MRAAIELGQADQQQGVFRRAAEVFEDRRGALVAGLAIGDAQLDHTLLGEQRQAGAGFIEQAPVEVGFGVEHLALAETLGAGGSANGVGGFLAQQRFVATDHVDRGEAALQVFAELGAI